MEPDYAAWMAAAADAQDDATLCFAGVMSRRRLRPAPYDVPLAGMGPGALAALVAECFPALAGRLVLPAGTLDHEERRIDEFHDLRALLMEHAAGSGARTFWVASAIATASMGGDHLWQDMGLPSRTVLSRLIRFYFPALFAQNVGDMKWKKFFYRMLCERAEVLLCKSPTCGQCVDYRLCFVHDPSPLEPISAGESEVPRAA